VIAAFSRGPDGAVLVDLRAAESRLLTDLFGDLLELLSAEAQPRPAGQEADPAAVDLTWSRS